MADHDELHEFDMAKVEQLLGDPTEQPADEAMCCRCEKFVG